MKNFNRAPKKTEDFKPESAVIEKNNSGAPENTEEELFNSNNKISAEKFKPKINEQSVVEAFSIMQMADQFLFRNNCNRLIPLDQVKNLPLPLEKLEIFNNSRENQKLHLQKMMFGQPISNLSYENQSMYYAAFLKIIKLMVQDAPEELKEVQKKLGVSIALTD